MKIKNGFIFIMIVVAMIAIGSVSATEDISADDISADEVVFEPIGSVQSTTKSYDVTTDMNLTQIQSKVDNGGSISFQPGTYTNFAITLSNNTYLIGNGANLYGDASNNVITLTGTSNTSISGFNIYINCNETNGISGSNVANCVIDNNNIYNGGDAINIFQYYSNVTVINNYIDNMTDKFGDGISLVNNRGNDFPMSSWAESLIANNTINGAIYGIFLGGNFKGTISGNNITNSTVGIHSQGKKAPSSGQLIAVISGNNLINVTTGINMFNPNVISLDLNHNVINASSYSINTDTNFGNTTDESISVTYNTFNGTVSQDFIDATYIAENNNGTNAYND